MSARAIHDPDALLRHRGYRVAISMTVNFAFGLVVLDNANAALFGAFGAFALLGFADFGGDTRSRTRAYLVLVAFGTVMIAVGTAASRYVLVGAVLLALLAFTITLANVFGGYFAAGGSAALLRPHLWTSSVAFRNSLRAALGLSAALVVADAVHAEHGFWVVLGTLTVLKSSAMRTGITAIQALLGSGLGFVVAAICAAAFEGGEVALWVGLPIFAFLSAYAPAAIHFVVGQASFTMLVVVLFNILTPEGWRTGLVRVESVAIGAAISLLIGAVLWPRGNRRALRQASADFYRSVAAYVGAALATLTRAAESPVDPEVVGRRRRDARAAELRADQALFDLLATPNAARPGAVAAWARLTSVGRSLRLTGDGIWALSHRPLAPIRAGEDQRQLDTLGAARVPEIASIGDRIEGPAATPAPVDPDAPVAALRTWLEHTDREDPASVGRTVAMVWCVEWIDVVDTLVALDDEPLRQVVATADLPWWR